MRRLTRCLVVAALLQSAGAAAHVRSESFSRWTLDGQVLNVQLTVSALETTRLVPVSGAASPEQALADYLGRRVSVRGAGPACRRLRGPRPVSARPGYRKVEIAWRCAGPPTVLEVRAFFDLAPEHVHYASWSTGSGWRQHLFSRDDPVWRLTAGPNDASGAFLAWLAHGIRHITSGWDHVAFLVAILLVCRRRRDAIWAVTGFTVGHSVSLSLAVLGLAQPDVPAVEAVIGLTIALVAVERAAGTLPSALPVAAASTASLLLFALLSPPLGGRLEASLLVGIALFSFCYLLLSHELSERAGFRLFITALFGLVHGFGFAGAFLAGGMETVALAPALAGFNIGVELGQLGLVGLFAAAAWVLRRAPRLYPPLTELATASLLGVGLFWFVQRGLSQL